MNHKIWKLSLGSLAVTAPIASVIACSGPTDGLSDSEYQKRVADLTSDEAQIQLETLWLTMVLKKNHPQIFDEKEDILKIEDNIDLIKFYIAKELAKDSKYLSKLGTKLLGIIKNGTPKYNIQDLKNWGFLNSYEYGYTEIIETNINKIAEVLMEETTLGFAVKIYQNLLMQDYLAIDKKEFSHYWKLQYDREFNFTTIQNLIDDGKNFLLVQKILEQKLFFKWEVEEQIAENRWVDPDYTNKKIVDALPQFMITPEGNKTIADFSNTNTKKQKLIKQLWEIPSFPLADTQVTLANYLGYKGVIGQESASGKLDFSEVSLKAATDKTYWTGILKEDSDTKLNELVTEKISFRDVKNDLKGKLTLLSGIMPIYQNEKLTMQGTFFENNLNKLAWQIYANDEKIYNDALKYYADETKKGGKDYKIKVNNPDVLRIWKDVKKLIYVK